jgi:hypothetical protein
MRRSYRHIDKCRICPTIAVDSQPNSFGALTSNGQVDSGLEGSWGCSSRRWPHWRPCPAAAAQRAGWGGGGLPQRRWPQRRWRGRGGGWRRGGGGGGSGGTAAIRISVGSVSVLLGLSVLWDIPGCTRSHRLSLLRRLFFLLRRRTASAHSARYGRRHRAAGRHYGIGPAATQPVFVLLHRPRGLLSADRQRPSGWLTVVPNSAPRAAPAPY